MSASISPTTKPSRARATARFTVTEDFPTPPFPEAMATTLAVDREVDGRRLVLLGLAALPCSIRAAFSSAFIVPVRTSTEVTPGSAPSLALTSSWIWPRSGQEATVSATSTSTRPALVDGRTSHHSEVHDVVAELGVDHAPQGVEQRLAARACFRRWSQARAYRGSECLVNRPDRGRQQWRGPVR